MASLKLLLIAKFKFLAKFSHYTVCRRQLQMNIILYYTAIRHSTRFNIYITLVQCLPNPITGTLCNVPCIDQGAWHSLLSKVGDDGDGEAYDG